MRKQIYRQISNFLADRKLVRGFTITELLVAIGLLAAVLAVSSVIFNYSIDAQRTALATSEIMRTLRAVTGQLNTDFLDLRKDAPVAFEFCRSGDLRADSMVFFAAGDFQTTNLYNGDTVRGNLARIYYGQAGKPDPNDPNLGEQKILARKQIILAPSESSPTDEYEPNSLTQQIQKFIDDPNVWLCRPDVNSSDVNDIPMYFAKGVDNFSIMLGTDVNSTTNRIDWWPTAADISASLKFFGYPDLIKFTFTIYDSKGILKNGRTFEHIVYIGD